MKKICEILAATSLFKGLTHTLYHHYCSKTNIRTAWKGEVIVHENDLCTGVGIIIEGLVAIQKYSRSGEYVTIDLLGAGEVFGEHHLFGANKRYETTLEAVTNTKIIFVSRDDLLSMISRSPLLLHNCLSLLSDRVCQKNQRIHLLSQRNLRQKISRYLLYLREKQLASDDSASDQVSEIISTQAVELPSSKEVIARLLAMPRPSFSRELISMEQDGLIRVSGRVIWLLDIHGLECGRSDSMDVPDDKQSGRSDNKQQ